MRDARRKPIAAAVLLGLAHCWADAFADTVDYLRVRLGLEAGPRPMRVALLAGRPCEITADGWRAT